MVQTGHRCAQHAIDVYSLSHGYMILGVVSRNIYEVASFQPCFSN